VIVGRAVATCYFLEVVATPPYAAAVRRRFPWRPDTPVRRFAILVPIALAMVAGLGLLIFPESGLVALGVALTLFLLAAVAFSWHLRSHHPHDRLGLANVVTLIRLASISLLLIPLIGGTADPVAIMAIAGLALSLDGVDGWLARRQKLVSDFGARFDMEVDAALGLVLSLLAVFLGGVTALALLIGVPRYVFGLAGLAMPWLRATLPPQPSRKVVFVIQTMTLIVVQSPWFAGPVGILFVLSAAAALAWSFGRDIVWLRRHRT